jgi:hypothetical protein
MGAVLAPYRAAVLSLLLQFPWTIYDIATHQYGFLLISLGSVVACAPALWKKATGGGVSSHGIPS